MFIEERLEKAETAINAARSMIEQLAEDFRRFEETQATVEVRLEQAVQSVSRSSGVDAESLAKLLVEVAKNIYPGIHPTAPQGTAQDDGVPKDKPGIGEAQKAEVDTPPPLSGDEEALTPAPSDGGSRSSEVVAPSGGGSASPAVDASKELLVCVVDGRSITGPRASVYLQEKQAAIIRRLLQGPATIYDLSYAAGDGADAKGTTNTRMRLANMRVLLADAGLEIRNVSPGKSGGDAAYRLQHTRRG